MDTVSPPYYGNSKRKGEKEIDHWKEGRRQHINELTIFGRVGNEIILDRIYVHIHESSICQFRTQFRAQMAQCFVEHSCSSIVARKTSVGIKIIGTSLNHRELLGKTTQGSSVVYPKFPPTLTIYSLVLILPNIENWPTIISNFSNFKKQSPSVTEQTTRIME